MQTTHLSEMYPAAPASTAPRKAAPRVTAAPKYYLYVLPMSHNCKGSEACYKCVKSNKLDTLYAVSESGSQYAPIVKTINVTMLDLDKCPQWLIGTPTLYETSTRSVYKGQNALGKLEGIAESPARQFWISESELQAMTSGGPGGGVGASITGRTGGINRPSALASASKSQRGMYKSRVPMNVPRGAQGAQGMGGSNALRGAWNAQKRMSADALSQSVSQTARSQLGMSGGDAKAPPSSAGGAGGGVDGSSFSMSTLQPAGDASTTTAGNFALDPSQYDTPEARAAKIVSQKKQDTSGTGGGQAAPTPTKSGMGKTAPPDGNYATTSPVDLAAAFKKRQAAHTGGQQQHS